MAQNQSQKCSKNSKIKLQSCPELIESPCTFQFQRIVVGNQAEFLPCEIHGFHIMDLPPSYEEAIKMALPRTFKK